MRIRKNIVLFLFLVPFGSSLYSGEREDAMSLEQAGDFTRATQAYLNWLDTHTGSSQFSGVLLHTASLYEKPNDALELLEHFLPVLETVDRYHVLARMAGLESSLGLLEEAARHYAMASRIGKGNAEEWLYASLSIRFTMGEFSTIRPALLNLVHQSRQPLIRDKAAALAAVCLACSTGERRQTAQALAELEQYLDEHAPVQSPEVWYALHQIAVLAEDSHIRKKSAEKLDRDFPIAMVSYLVDFKLSEWETPLFCFILPGTPSGESVQVGAFKNRDAATSLRLELENDDFISWIERNGDVWRVFVNDPAHDAVSRLEAQGYKSLF